jgi:arabinogalactan endo-1,4-beta-galactosidase
MKFMLDFHYSDTWADPGHQTKPAAWTNLTFTRLTQQLYDYNSNSIAAFRNAGAMPDYVQVGNEIIGGMLWPDGAVPGADAGVQWAQLGQLMSAAVEGIAAAAGTNMPKIIVHIDRGGDWASTKWFFDNLNAQGFTYDFIGQSYYPYWHGSLTNMAWCLTNTIKRYLKPVMIVETDFPWTNSYWATNIYGIAPGTNGQVQYLVSLAKEILKAPQQMGAGIVWWGAEYQAVNGVNEAGFHTASFFNSAGNVLPIADAFGQLATPVELNTSVTGSTLNLRWPLSGAGMSLMTTTNLKSPWLPVTNGVQNAGTLFNVALQLSATGCFYRLQN